MLYSKGIVVQSRRNLNIGVSDSTIPNSNYLSDFDLSSINEIVRDLSRLVESDDGGMYWGQEQIMIDSSPEVSFCKDEMYGESLSEVSTRSLLNLMIEIQKMKTEYQEPNNLKKIIRHVFAIVKLDPDNHRRWPESDTSFAVTIDDIYITLVLKPEDFDLTVDEYVNQLPTTFY